VPTNATITVAAIVEAVGLDAGRLVLGTFQAASAQDPILASSYQALSTVGKSLSGADRQGLIDALATAGNWPDAVRDAVKALGGAWRPRWQIEGYQSEPTLEQIQAEVDAAIIAEEARQRMTVINNRRRKWDEISAAVRSQIESGALEAIEDITTDLTNRWSA
jgi:hypothetical protein